MALLAMTTMMALLAMMAFFAMTSSLDAVLWEALSAMAALSPMILSNVQSKLLRAVSDENWSTNGPLSDCFTGMKDGEGGSSVFLKADDGTVHLNPMQSQQGL
jgi:hypothetical protein